MLYQRSNAFLRSASLIVAAVTPISEIGGCRAEEPLAQRTAEHVTKSSAAGASDPQRTVVSYQNFNSAQVPRNGDGNTYPSWWQGDGEGGQFVARINTTDAVSGHCLQLDLQNTAGADNMLYAQFNPYNYDSANGLYDVLPKRGFARDYAVDAAQWRLNTYNRMRFWIKVPFNAAGLRIDGIENYHVGTYVKRANHADQNSDEAGGNHYYHHLILPNGAESGGQWIRVILNMHPDHQRDKPGDLEVGNQPHPTGEAGINYFDALTRWYIQQKDPPISPAPAQFLLDEIEFYHETYAENDSQIYSLAAVYNPVNNRTIVTWQRNKNENTIRHEVRYLVGPQTQSPHTIGWNNLLSAPDGLITPLGWQGYNGMVYDTTAMSLPDNALGAWIAIKPENSSHFSAIYVRKSK
jgi:hypothetical protein